MKNSCLVIGIVLLLAGCHSKDENKYRGWSVYLGGADRNHYSTLDAIDTNNVAHLKIAWTYAAPDSGQMQMNPIMVNGMVYGVSAAFKAFAIDAATGKEIWVYKEVTPFGGNSSRGVAYWEDGNDRRILYAAGSSLIALDAATGKPIGSFGDSGRVDLHTGLPASANNKFITATTPGTVYKDLIIVPVRLSEQADAAPGDIRAFNIRSGKLAWTFHTIPHPGEKGYETWPADAWKNSNIGGANNWAGMALDEKTGTLFIPIGSASPDFYGGNRKGANLFSNCLLALDAANGQYKWHYQFIHHDLWDRDPPAPPNLITVTHKGKSIDAVAQVTKQGLTFLFNRNTGEPLFPINEVPAIATNLPGDAAWPTQPVPVLPKPFARRADQLTVNDISPFANNKEELASIFAASDKRMFAPPDTSKRILLLPGYDGGAEWGGAGADPEKGILYVNANEMAWFLKLNPQPTTVRIESKAGSSAGEQLYTTYCSGCHGKEKLGNPTSGYPDISHIVQQRSGTYVHALIAGGKGRMPGFPSMAKEDRQRLVDYLFGAGKKEAGGQSIAMVQQDPYGHDGYQKFLDDQGLPGIAPPWGTITAIDLNTGQHLWQVPFGTTPGLPHQDKQPTGCENYGGPIITKNGLLLIAAAKDGMFRAYNRYTGKLLWQTPLPAASFATPAMYSVHGKQYIVLACGGEKLGTKKGNLLVAFALE